MTSLRLILLAFLFTGQSLFPGQVVQFSSYLGLIERLYDGFVEIGDVLDEGNHGIGTTHQVNGEMVILDGVAYRVTTEGTVERVGPRETSPYATVAEVEKSDAFVLTLPPGTTVENLKDILLRSAGSAFQPNFPYAIRLEGEFTSARLRSVPKLEKPYPPLTQVAANQVVFNFENSDLTLVGFWNPPYAAAFNPPEWHIHGLTAARDEGGHVLSFETGEGVVAYLWKLTGFDIRLPDSAEFAEADFSGDQSDVVQRVNRDK